MIDPTMTENQLNRVACLLKELDRKQPEPARERRRQLRLAFRTTARLCLVDHPQRRQIKVFTRNLSASGLSLISDHPFAPNERFTITLQLRPNLRRSMLCKVAFTRQPAPGIYEIGSIFTEVLPDDPAASDHSQTNVLVTT